MPKIRDLGISSIPFPRVQQNGAGGYWMCNPTIDQGPPDCVPSCGQTPPQCHPTNKPDCNPSPRPDVCPAGTCQETCGATEPGKRNARELPHDAVLLLRQQLQHQIHGQLHG